MAALFDLDQERAAELRLWQAVFQRDGNKAAAWRCYRLARAWDLPVPDSIMAELDRVAGAIGDEVERTRTFEGEAKRVAKDEPGLTSMRVGKIVTEAHRGSVEPAAALLAWERDFEVARAVAVLRLDGLKEWEAVERVSKGTHDLAYGVRIESDSVSFSPVSTPPGLTVDLVRRAVRRVRDLSTDMAETSGLKSMTEGEGIVTD